MPEHDWKTSGAPLVETDIQELGDKRLNEVESVAREREKALSAASAFKIPGQDELTNPDRSSGPKIHWRQLLQRLQKICPKLKPKDSNVRGVETIALYYPKTDSEKINDGSMYQMALTPTEKFHRDHKYVGGFDKAWLPMYSHLQLDTSKLPTREVRGVMTVLLMLVHSRCITAEQIKQEFGDPAEDQRGNRYLEQTREN